MRIRTALFVAVACLSGGSAFSQIGPVSSGFQPAIPLAGGDPAAILLSRDDIQRDLELTDAQLGALDDIQDGLWMQLQPKTDDSGNPDPAAPTPNVAQLLKRASEESMKVLTSSQARRLREIAIQLSSGLGLVDRDLQRDLALTDAQRSKIQSLMNLASAANRSVTEKATRGEVPPDQAPQTIKKNLRTLAQEIMKVLTNIQKEKLKSLGGLPLKGAAKQSD